MSMSRRKFLGSSAAAVLVAGTVAKGKVFGANERIAVAVVGFNGQGGSHIKEYLANEGAEVVALCDVDRNVLDRGAAAVANAQGAEPKKYVDIQELLADGAVDAISIATPNHWHSLAAVWGCQAGKDVYVEKPLSHTYWEGKQLVAAAKKYGRVVQHGTQQRSTPTTMRDVQAMRDGIIGDIFMTRGVVYKNGNRGSIGFAPPEPAPENLEWNLWQGPAPEREYCKNYVHYNWHWFWDYGNGESGNQGVHEMDVAVWTMNNGLPVKVYSTGGRYAWDDQAETPNTQIISFTYADGKTLTFEVRNLGSFREADKDPCSNSVFGSEGYWTRGEGFFNYKNEPIPVDAPLPESNGRIGNFLQAIRSRKPEDNRAPAEVGHLSCAHIHLGNIAYRLGRSLEFDPATETFEGDEEANGMLKRNYREPFAVPEIA